MKKNHTHPQILFFLTLIALVLLLACSSTDKKTTTTQASARGAGARQPPMMVDFIIAKPTLINERIEVPGNLMPFESTEIHPEISGRLVQLNITEGRVISKG